MQNKKTNTENKHLVNKAIYFIIFAFLFIIPALSQAYSFWGNTYENYELGDYSITSYHVNIDVSEKNVLDIEEIITIQPEKHMRGIVRAIPLVQVVSFEENGKTYSLKYKTNIEDISADDTYQIYKENGFLYIRLGKENDWFIASKTYNIKYKLDLGDDKIAEFDQLYFNVIGTDWDVPISNISFNITMPKNLPSEKEMFVYFGEHGSGTQQSVEVEADLKTFTYSHPETLNAYEGLTVRLALDKDYFDFSIVQTLAWIFSAIMFVLLIGLGIYFLQKLLKIKKQIITPVVMFDPPENLPPSELGYIIDGVVDNQDISSLIVYWAEKGFLKINENKKRYTLTKIKDMEKISNYETTIFNKIFATADTRNLEDIGQLIYLEVNKAKLEIQKKHQNSQFNIKNKNAKKLFAFIATVLVTGISTIVLRFSVEPLNRLGVALLGIISLAIAFKFMHKEQIRFKKSLNQTKDRTLFYLLFILFIWVLIASLGFNFYFDKLLLSFIVLFPAIIGMFIAFKLEIRKEEGLELFGQVLGFKQFISLTEKDKIKMLVKENPEMFYAILPYAYVLGVSQEWMDKFEGLALQAPNWYVSTSNIGVFDYLVMRSVFNSIMFSSTAQMGYKPPNVNSTNTRGGGSGGFGGGFTGGGFGGGGGRGW